jgi:hypothetical protein
MKDDELLNRWQLIWRSIDEARLMPRLMVTTSFFALVGYVFYGTQHYHAVVNGALVQSAAGQATFGELTPVLGAVTAFYAITIPVLSRLFLDMWKDYRQSGTDWTHVEVKAEVGAANAPTGPSEGRS